ncbi:hypothetical protein [Microcoleus sp. AR_TQ3_B6]|uniref:hypothetical protein n=1 Tax=Microcoleus sp. AR_TQ3_B6 TaxID=3055284 RepID=UPI002FD4A869
MFFESAAAGGPVRWSEAKLLHCKGLTRSPKGGIERKNFTYHSKKAHTVPVWSVPLMNCA